MSTRIFKYNPLNDEVFREVKIVCGSDCSRQCDGKVCAIDLAVMQALEAAFNSKAFKIERDEQIKDDGNLITYSYGVCIRNLVGEVVNTFKSNPKS